MLPRMLTAAVLAASLFLATSPAPAAVVVSMFDNFDTGDGYHATNGNFVHWINDYLSLGQGTSSEDLAMAFTAAGSGYEAITIELALTLQYGDNELDISVLDDASGVPGSVLETWHLSGAIPAYPGVGAPVSVNSSTLALTAGTQYWVAVSVSGPADTQAVWHDNTVGYMGLVAGMHELWGNAATWTPSTFGSATMRILGVSRTVGVSATSWSSVKSLFD